MRSCNATIVLLVFNIAEISTNDYKGNQFKKRHADVEYSKRERNILNLGIGCFDAPLQMFYSISFEMIRAL